MSESTEPSYWPMPNDAENHHENALSALRTAREIANRLADGGQAMLQVVLTTAQVHATLAAAAVEMEAAAYLAAPPTDTDHDGDGHVAACDDCRTEKLTQIRDTVENYLDGLGYLGTHNTHDTATDVAQIVELVVFGIHNLTPLPPEKP